MNTITAGVIMTQSRIKSDLYLGIYNTGILWHNFSLVEEEGRKDKKRVEGIFRENAIWNNAFF